MSLKSRKSAIIEAIASSSAIKSWANTKYGRDHKVFSAVNSRNMPGEDACPYVTLAAFGESVSQRRREQEYSFAFVGFVNDDTIATTSYANLVKYNGEDNIEDFRKLIETEIKGTLVNEQMDVDTDTDVNEDFPFIRFEMIVTITAPVLIGADPLA